MTVVRNEPIFYTDNVVDERFRGAPFFGIRSIDSVRNLTSAPWHPADLPAVCNRMADSVS